MMMMISTRKKRKRQNRSSRCCCHSFVSKIMRCTSISPLSFTFLKSFVLGSQCFLELVVPTCPSIRSFIMCKLIFYNPHHLIFPTSCLKTLTFSRFAVVYHCSPLFLTVYTAIDIDKQKYTYRLVK